MLRSGMLKTGMLKSGMLECSPTPVERIVPGMPASRPQNSLRRDMLIIEIE